jgi:hypothetical protein
MAYRWHPEEYRQPHNGQSVFGGGMIPTIKHPDTTKADWRTPVSWGSQDHPELPSSQKASSQNGSGYPMYMQPWSGEDETGNFTQTGADKKYTFTKPTKKGYSGESGDLYYEKPDENPHEDPHGGSTVPRKPKPNPKSPSGGMALPLPQKVK